MQIRNFQKEMNKTPKDFYKNSIFSKDSRFFLIKIAVFLFIY